jgi:hypothetical protein
MGSPSHCRRVARLTEGASSSGQDGGGAAAPYSDPPRSKALRHVIRSRFSEHPSLYLPFARRRYPGPSPKVVDNETQVVIDGYTRSACTFAVYAFQLSQPKPVRLAHHLHAPAQLLEAARRGIPSIVVIREPQGALLSQIVREPHVSLRGALESYQRFYSLLVPYGPALVAGEFQDVTNDFGAVINRLNERFGTHYAEFVASKENTDRCFDLIKERPTRDPEWREMVLGFETGTVALPELLAARPTSRGTTEDRDTWIPSADRNEAKRSLQERWDDEALMPLRERAVAAYRAFLAAAG